MYSLARKVLFRLDPELSHELSMDWLGAIARLKLLGPLVTKVSDPVEVMGLNFNNRVGLAAGLDKNADSIDSLGEVGFGFIEVGTVTPLAQKGNPSPRLFRLKEQNAIINRMGFNNKGVDHLVEKVKKRQFSGILGINIGKNKITPEENALDDYTKCLDAVYEYADYITVNISSPNTPGLRNLQFGDNLKTLLKGIKEKQSALSDKFSNYVPIAVKIAPDMSTEELKSVATEIIEQGMDAIVATNTTISREGVEGSVYANEAGGLSGAPVKEKSTLVIRTLSAHIQGEIPIIGVGGIMSPEDAVEKIKAGASLVQLYSGFIYSGPSLIRDSARAIASSCN